VQWQYALQSVVCVVCFAAHSTQYTHYRLKHILPLHSNYEYFNDVFLLIIFTKTVTLAKFRRILPDDGPSGPKHVGANILSVSCSILCFNKECICWQKSFELIKMHGKTTIKTLSLVGNQT
jgi:hypothetical protein